MKIFKQRALTLCVQASLLASMSSVINTVLAEEAKQINLNLLLPC